MSALKLLPENTNSRHEDFLKKNPAYIFHHFMKCGGTSVGYNLQFWFNLVYDHLIYDDRLDEYRRNRIDPGKIGSDYCIVGHYAYEGAHLFERYPELIDDNEKIKAFTFIRDPLEFCISFYYYTKKNERNRENTLKEFIDANANLYAYYFPCTDEDYKEVLDRYLFIGITEHLQKSFDKLAGIVNKRKLTIPVLNKTQRDSQLSILTEKYVDEFKEKYYLDYKIYNYCKEKFLDS